ncbi:MAG: anti-sigma F factor [Lachnospiraceae bacterium]|nr:anti-sigma F factor [Lachnospiraceae bacterium]
MVKQNREIQNSFYKSREDAVNKMELRFTPLSENEGFARVAVAAFMTELDPTLEEVEDVKTAVSEAVTNSIIHGYERVEGKEQALEGEQWVLIEAYLTKGTVHIRIEDKGVGMEDVEKAMEPLFTTKPELERSGMGFAFMEAFMDELYVESGPGDGTVVYMSKQIGGQ